MDDFRRLVAETVDAENLEALAVEEYLEQSRRLPCDLRARDVAEMRLADLVGDFALSELAFGFAERADFGVGVDSRRNAFYEIVKRGLFRDVQADETSLIERRA